MTLGRFSLYSVDHFIWIFKNKGFTLKYLKKKYFAKYTTIFWQFQIILLLELLIYIHLKFTSILGVFTLFLGMSWQRIRCWKTREFIKGIIFHFFLHRINYKLVPFIYIVFINSLTNKKTNLKACFDAELFLKQLNSF